jgi:hypothetical protein
MKTILWRSSSSDYEEECSIEIWRDNGKYYIRTYGHCVMIGDYDSTEKVSTEDALEIMLQEVENEDEEE